MRLSRVAQFIGQLALAPGNPFRTWPWWGSVGGSHTWMDLVQDMVVVFTAQSPK